MIGRIAPRRQRCTRGLDRSAVDDTGRMDVRRSAGGRVDAHRLNAHRAESRVSAYVYGDVLVLAATVGVSAGAIRSGAAVLVVVGTMISTYIAHVLADVVGAVFGGDPLRAALLAELRDSVPVLSAGSPSVVLLGAAAFGWPPAVWAQSIAAAFLIARIAAIGLVYRRFHATISLPRALAFGVLAAVAATAAAAVKLAVAH
jgi:hypothetical protein